MQKLLFFDIDGTLAMPGYPPAEDTVRAIRAARAAGHRAFLCTGRGEHMVSDDIAGIGFDGGIYHAGGRAVLDGRVIYENHADPSMLEEVLPLIRENSIFYSIET
ncbi:MAG: HAD hydrolase family protein, partial [bacterium]